MDRAVILDRISRGRTDAVHDLLRLPDWRTMLVEGRVRPLQWFVYYGDVTAMKTVLEAGGDLKSLDLGEEFGNAAFFGHWKMCDFLIHHGADPKSVHSTTGETPLHRAAAYADAATIEFLLAHGAEREARDVHGDSPLSWASEHLRPGNILGLLSFGKHRIGAGAVERMTSDHGEGWGNGMERNLLGDYLPESSGPVHGSDLGRVDG